MRTILLRTMMALLITLIVALTGKAMAAPFTQNGALSPGAQSEPGAPTVTVVAGSGEAVQSDTQSAARPDAETQTGAAPQTIYGNGYTYRHFWGYKNGWWVLTLTDPSITANSRVFVSIGETHSNGGKFVGAAHYTVHNVAPNNGSVTIRVHIDWDNPIPLTADYLVINP